ncbi:phosphonoacetaldehyde reductase [Candidatus Woesearchaeota archaeon]|nr:phosphonoacetaldehyde reductase [Candidatus Woesearchaeota archaeon]
MKQKEFFGYGSINKIAGIASELDTKRIFLVTGRDSYEHSGVKNCLDMLLHHYEINRFNQFSSNPRLVDIMRGFELFKKEDYELIIAVGGGSVIDVAKAIKLFNFNKCSSKTPLVAVPTTSGTGSEATYYIVYYIGKEKQSEGLPEITLPDYSICDPTFTMNIPKKIAAATGMDALGQAIESYWNINSTKESKEFAKQSISLLIDNLEKSVGNPDPELKEKVMRAANLSGKAINITKTTACHSISYPITSYFHIHHGHAVGLTLGEMLVYNYYSKQECVDQRGEDYLKSALEEITALIGGKDVIEARDILYDLMKNIGLETKLIDLGINKEGIEVIIKRGFNPERVKNNPRHLDEDNLREILESIY